MLKPIKHYDMYFVEILNTVIQINLNFILNYSQCKYFIKQRDVYTSRYILCNFCELILYLLI